MRDPARPQDLQQVGRRVRLHRIHRAARKLLDEESGGACRGVRANERYRLGRATIGDIDRSEEHTSELQSLMRISYAVFCLKKKKNNRQTKLSNKCNTDTTTI